MALLGAQLVITLVMVSIIQKVSPHFSLAKWILCSTGLTRFLHPTDEDLKNLAGFNKKDGKDGKGGKHKGNKGGKNGHVENASATFNIPRNIDVQLETAKISQFDVIHLRYFTEYQWLIDFSVYSIIVYIISEVYHFFVPIGDEVNLSMLWCLLVIFFAFKLLSSLTIQYFKSDESIGERSTCIVTGLTYLLISMIILIVPETTLEIGLDDAYRSFNEGASGFLQNQGLSSSGPASKIVIKFFIAVTCGIIGALFTFPGLRMARMHVDSLRYCKDRKFLKFLLNLSFALPFLLVLLWVKPISRDYLSARIFSGMKEPLMTPSAFETFRLVAVVFTVLLRLVLMPIYLQAYLNLAYDRVEEQKKEAGRITNQEYQRKITSIFYYLCVVTLQYAAPVLMCLFLTLVYKTSGGYSWTSFWSSASAVNPDECSIDPAEAVKEVVEKIVDSVETASPPEAEEMNILQVAQNFHLSLQSLKSVFTEAVFRGLFGFATWWSCFVWFAATSLGMVYQHYFTNQT